MCVPPPQIEATNVAKNGLEAYVYSMRNRLHADLADFISDAARSEFSSALDKMEDWLYDEGEDVERQVYLEKLSELKKVCAQLVSLGLDKLSRD